MSCCCEDKCLELKIKKGESIGFAFSFSKQGVPVDLTDSQMVMEVRENIIDDGNYIFSKTIDDESDRDTVGLITEPTEGKFFFKVNDTDIAGMSTTKPYFVAIYHIVGDVKDCISANNGQVARFLVFNP